MGKRIAILGAGAVGGYTGGYMAHAGHDVTLIDFWHDHIEAIRTRGLELSGPDGTVTVKPKALHLGEASSLSRAKPIDIAFVSVKSYDTEWMTALIKPYLSPDGFVVSLQNCLNEETVAGVVGWGRTMGCIAAKIAVELYEPGRIRRDAARMIEGYNVFRVGEPHGAVTERVKEVAAILQDVDNAKVTTNLWGERWSKLSNNAQTGGLAASTGLGANQAKYDERTRRFMIDIGVEAARIGRALGYRMEKIGKLESDLYLRAADGDAAARAEIDRLFAEEGNPKPPKRLSSMGQDVMKGRRTEIEFLNGFIVDSARKAGLDAPFNARVVDIVKRVQRGELTARPENVIDAPLAA